MFLQAAALPELGIEQVKGLISSWIALFMYMLSAAAMRSGALSDFTKLMGQYGKMNENIAANLGISVGLWHYY